MRRSTRRRRLTRAPLLLGLLALLTCEFPRAAPGDYASTAMLVAPPPGYFELWRELTECVDRYADFRSVRWLAVPDTARFRSPRSGSAVLGVWLRTTSAIAIREDLLPGRTGFDRAVIRHEMLHAILGDGSHVHPAFRPGNGCGVAASYRHPM